MPSGAKKRKAAKKKKQNLSNNPSHLNAGDEDRESDGGENRSPRSEGEEEEITEGSRVKSDEKQIKVGESEDDESDKKHESDSSNSDDENRGGMKDTRAESSIDPTKVDDSVSIEATCNSPIDDSAMGEKITLLIEPVEVHKEQSPSDISVAAPYVVKSGTRENGEKKFSTCVADKISLSLERTIDQSDANPANITKSEDSRECVKQVFDDTAPLQYNAPPPNNGAQHVKDSLVIQPLFPGEKTSWKSCCGLFEVFTRSAA